jgi:hypothetical protein
MHVRAFAINFFPGVLRPDPHSRRKGPREGTRREGGRREGRAGKGRGDGGVVERRRGRGRKGRRGDGEGKAGNGVRNWGVPLLNAFRRGLMMQCALGVRVAPPSPGASTP